MASTDPSGPIERESSSFFRADVAEQVCIGDLFLMLSVPIVLSVVYWLPESVQQSLVLDYRNPSLSNLWTAAYVHRGLAHFTSNLVAYCLFIAPIYLLLVLAGERRLFRNTFLSFLLILPPVLAGVNITVISQGTGAGFSGIVAAFVGLLPVSLFVFVHNRVSRKIDSSDGVWLFLITAGSIAWIYLGVLEAAAIFLISGLLVVFNIHRIGIDGARAAVSELFAMNGYFEVVGLAVLLYLISPLSLFPPDIVQDAHTVNILSHYVGLFFGFFGPLAFTIFGDYLPTVVGRMPEVGMK